MMWLSLLTLALCGTSSAYSMAQNYDYTNWFTSFNYMSDPDPTHGLVQYINLASAQSLGLTKVIGKQVFMGVDNTTVLASGVGRKSIWLESKNSFTHGLLIGDFAHIPGNDCGIWPAFWSINNGPGYGEIDIMESFSDLTVSYTTLHTDTVCTFESPTNLMTGSYNQDSFDCNTDTSGIGCSIIGPDGYFGTPFNNQGGGVYAMEWTSSHIKVWAFPRAKIPADITSGAPNPSGWPLPVANFDSAYGNCNIDASFPAQTIYFDTTFCGAEASGDAWTSWTDCSAKTGVSTCEAYVAGTPHAFDNAYWLVNSVKLYQ